MEKRPANQEQNVAKKEEEISYFKNCEKCLKFFTTEQAFETHSKIKHCQVPQEKEQSEQSEGEGEQEQEQDPAQSKANTKKSNSKNIPFKNRMLQIQRNQLEDNIYTFLGELGEKNAEPTTNRSDFVFQNQNQKLTGQTNYSVNKVIRTPYEEPIKCADQVPVADYIQKSKNKQFLLKLKQQLQILEEKVEAERQIWELRDPMAPEEETQDQFSLMDIKKLIQNYPKRNAQLNYPHFSIYLLWIGRICKSPAFKEFFTIMGEYLAEYYAIETNKLKGQSSYDNWNNYHKAYETRKVEPSLLQHLKIFDEKTCKKFIQYYVQWVSLFKALNI